ncbi:MAG: glycosyltransferase [Flavobacteriaceae bacterium CG18_big_fil_WC_8_21_14_2_50_34_36]|nr:glycosyltransferase [Bacteroidota bacterium]PIQ16997.1 MAG: glycosyltransferase [Flavobacteriaceae bacterium CG18_big_fil_WC_8_21_14_2_50_34_36]PJC06336.1 MAG: glycosyltransferase [Flavobacteriaceae bacterium CG_4_9_14_0_8_um_filter_34_30]
MKKKILFIHGPLGGGGAERVLLDVLHNLDYTKYDVDLCLIVKQGILLPEVPAQVTIISLWETYTLYYKIAYRLSIWFGNNSMFRAVLRKKITKQYDVEISFLEGMPIKLHALMESNAKKITWVHCDLFNFPYEAKQFSNNEEIRAYNKMDTVVCVSNDSLQAFEKRFPTCNSDRMVIYNPIDINKIVRLANEVKAIPNDIFTIVIVGRLTPPKKMDRVIRLASQCKKEQIKVHFQIIGDGELKGELFALRKALEVEDMVEFTGFVKNPFPYIKNADLLLLSSGFEGFGLVVCEAMCLGVPVVSTKTAGPIEIIDHNKYGLLCDHDDESIYAAVKKMMDDEALRMHYQKLGLQRANEFNVENTITQFDKMIKDLIL